MTSHVLIRASAGTGKTYALVRAYLDAVSGGLAPHQIIALTFTRKAAQELGMRIQQGMLDADLLAGAETLHQAPITNFHGLAMRLLMEWDPEFGGARPVRILGEALEDRDLFCTSCERSWFSRSTDVALERLAFHFGVAENLPRSLWQVVADARERGVAPESLFQQEQDGFAFRETLHQGLMRACDELAASLGDLTARSKETLDRFLQYRPPKRDDDLDVWARGWEERGALLNRRGGLSKLVSADLLRTMKKDVWLPFGVTRSEALRSDLRDVFGRAWSQYGVEKQRMHAYDFPDLIERCMLLLDSNRELQKTLQRDIRLVLVDEAQDTNLLQRAFVHRLAGVEVGGREPARLVVVGDHKQSIYTFRGADPHAFARFTEDISQLGGEHRTQDKSFRSAPELIEVINEISGDLFPDIDEPLVSQPERGGKCAPLGRVAAHWLECSDVEVEPTRTAEWIAHAVGEGGSPQDFAVLLPVMTRADVFEHALRDVGLPVLRIDGKASAWSTQTESLFGWMRWLVDARDLVGLIKGLRDRRLGLSESTIARLCAGGNRGLLHAFRKGELDVDAFPKADQAALAGLQRAVPDLVRASRQSSTVQWLRLVDDSLGLPRASGGDLSMDRLWELASSWNVGARGSIKQFVLELAMRRERGVPEGARISSIENQAVRLMTIHQAKGLEFPTVILPEIYRSARLDTDPVRFDEERGALFRAREDGRWLDHPWWRDAAERKRQKEQDELRRLLYVAMTRAQRELVFVDVGTRRSGSFATWLRPARASLRERGLISDATAPGGVDPLTPSGDTRAPRLDAEKKSILRQPRSVYTVPVTQLETFLQCSRRGFLAHTLRARVPHHRKPRGRDRMDPRERGHLVHAVLAEWIESEGSDCDGFVRSRLDARVAVSSPDVVELEQTLQRFVHSPFGQLLNQLPLGAVRPELAFRSELTDKLHMLGQIDLLYEHEGQLHIADYKLARRNNEELKSYETQLQLYAIAAAELCGVEGDIHLRLVFLLDSSPLHTFVSTAEDRTTLRKRIVALEPILISGAEEGWVRKSHDACVELFCPFLGQCHGFLGRIDDKPSSGQIALDRL